MKPTAQQQAVIDSTEKEILVEAGAGSGKTTTTVGRYIRLLDDGLDPGKILVFTFTDKAAGELRERVREARVRQATAAGDANPEAVSMSSSWIGTFHSICTRILRAYPVESGVDPLYSVLETTASETLKQDAFDEAVRKFREADPEDRDEFLATYQLYRLRDTISYAYEQLRSRGMERPALPSFERTPRPVEGLSRLFRAAVVAQETGVAKGQQAKLDTAIALLGDHIGQVTHDDLAPLAFSSSKDGVSQYCEIYREVVPALLTHEVGDDWREFMGALLKDYGEVYARLKRLRSALDYEDLQLTTLRLLREHPEIRAGYRQRFDEIMVDEFQDTNQLQLDLIGELQGDGTTLITVGDEMQSIYGFRHADVELFRARRDDPRVTPYPLTENFRSQKSVIETINRVGNELDRQVTKREGEARMARHVFAELTPGLPEEGQSSNSLILTAHDGWKELDLGPLAPAIPAEEKIGKEQDHFNQAEALLVAHRLRELVDDPSNDIEQGDITILLRAKTRTDIYVSALGQVGLTPYVVAGSGFWKKPEAIELVSLLSTIANPLDENHLLGALTSPACAVSTDGLWLIRKASPKYGLLWPTIRALATPGSKVPDGTDEERLGLVPQVDRDRLKGFVATIDLLRDRRSSLPLDELTELAVTETGYDLAILHRDDTGNGLANVRRVESLAREFESANGRDPRAFLDWVALSEELDSEASVATADENSDVVRLMTVHAAKGLEFKVTCVPDLSRANTNRHDTQLRFGRSAPGDPSDFPVGLRVPRIAGGNVDLYAWDELAAQAKRSTEDEELRLLHVALTRAERHLVMSGVIPAKWPDNLTKKGVPTESTPMITRISYAFGLDPEDSASWPGEIPGGGPGEAPISLTPNLPGADRAAMLAGDGERLLVPTRVATGRPPLGRPEVAVHPDVPLSFSAIGEYAECPARFHARRILRLRDPGFQAGGFDPQAELISERDHGREFGNAVHDVFEWMAGSGWKRPSSDVVRASLEQYGLDPDEKDREERAITMIGDFLGSDLGERVRAGRCRAEVPILVRSGTVMVRGFIDLVAEGGKRPLIVDYKTNSLGGSSAAEKMAGYELQRDLYALALGSAGGHEAVDTEWVFLEDAGNPVGKTLTRDDFEVVRTELAAIVGEINSGGGAAGRASGGREPCGHCWACERMGAEPEADPAPTTLF